MGTWAAITKLDAPDEPEVGRGLEGSGISVAVVDTNAIIAGIQLDRIAETAVTIPEVLSEVRDKHTRQILASLPFKLQYQQPAEESVKAGEQVALETTNSLTFCLLEQPQPHPLSHHDPQTQTAAHSVLRCNTAL